MPLAEVGRGVHTIVVKVDVPQPEMSRFTIVVSSTTLWSSCWWISSGSRDLFLLQHAHSFFHDALKHYGELIIHFAWVGWRHCMCEEENENMIKGVWNELKPCGVFIEWWRMKFDFFFDCFRFFEALAVKIASFQFKRSNSYSNDQISI
jgi:hypothetical protein